MHFDEVENFRLCDAIEAKPMRRSGY